MLGESEGGAIVLQQQQIIHLYQVTPNLTQLTVLQ